MHKIWNGVELGRTLCLGRDVKAIGKTKEHDDRFIAIYSERAKNQVLYSEGPMRKYAEFICTDQMNTSYFPFVQTRNSFNERLYVSVMHYRREFMLLTPFTLAI